uniref:Uncharacterized protein n=1 Tax=Hyaloperonospora arabidopsidis (strain Emoy2) TaxID=559515 RepID=M4BLA5_HYAAE
MLAVDLDVIKLGPLNKALTSLGCHLKHTHTDRRTHKDIFDLKVRHSPCAQSIIILGLTTCPLSSFAHAGVLDRQATNS